MRSSLPTANLHIIEVYQLSGHAHRYNTAVLEQHDQHSAETPEGAADTQHVLAPATVTVTLCRTCTAFMQRRTAGSSHQCLTCQEPDTLCCCL